MPGDFSHDHQLRLRPDVKLRLSEARDLVRDLSEHESVLLLSAPGVGKTEMVHDLASELGLEVRSVLGTQLAPEDLSGLPRLVGERTVFCPPRVLLPEDDTPFLLFLDELPASSPDVQKAMYSLLLDRRIGEHRLPAGSRVVAAGNRASDRALVRSLSNALVNRVFLVEVTADAGEWLAWAERANVRHEVREFVRLRPEALLREPTTQGEPFSTPRAWVSLAQALDRVSAGGSGTATVRRSLAFGRVSAEDASLFADSGWRCLVGSRAADLVSGAARLPRPDDAAYALALDLVHRGAVAGELDGLPRSTVDAFLAGLDREHQYTLYGRDRSVWERLATPPEDGSRGLFDRRGWPS